MLNAKIEQSKNDLASSGLLQHTTARLRFANRYRKSSGSMRRQMVALPERKNRLLHELNKAEKLGATSDGKLIFLFEYFHNSAVMRELGRLAANCRISVAIKNDERDNAAATRSNNHLNPGARRFGGMTMCKTYGSSG